MKHEEAIARAAELSPQLAEAFGEATLPGADLLTRAAVVPALDDDGEPVGDDYSCVLQVGWKARVAAADYGNYVQLDRVPGPQFREAIVRLLQLDLQRRRDALSR